MCKRCDRIQNRRERMLRLMRTGLITAGELAEALKVTPRTIYREVTSLRRDGYPIAGEAGVGYLLRNREANRG
jgi:predicted DNA-binding transcriptional regulator YafY